MKLCYSLQAKLRLHASWYSALAIAVMMTLAACNASTPKTPALDAELTPTVASIMQLSMTPTSTPSVPPAEAIALTVVDTYTVSIELPVHGKLLAKACSSVVTYLRYGDAYMPCAIGFVDWENRRWIQLYRFDDPVSFDFPKFCARIKWSPDGTRFICEQGFAGTYSYSFRVIRADGKAQFDGKFIASWSPDGKYVDALSFVTAYQGAFGWGLTVYDATSWQDVCNLSSAFECNGSNNPACKLPLVDGRVRTITMTGSYGFDALICDSSKICSSSRNVDFTQESYHSDRYRVTIENYWLRVTDSKSNRTTTFVVPDYKIMGYAWSPN